MSIWKTVAKIRVKTFICWFWNWVYDISSSIFRSLKVILGQFEAWLPRCRRKPLFAGCEIGFKVLFLNIGGYFSSIRGMVSKTQAKIFISLLRNWFTAINVLYIEHWGYFASIGGRVPINSQTFIRQFWNWI